MPEGFLSAFADWQGAHIRKRLAERYPPDTKILVTPEATAVELQLVLDDGASLETELPFLSLEEFVRQGPVILHAPETGERGAEAAPVRIDLVQPNGTTIDGIGLILQEQDGAARLHSGTTMRGATSAETSLVPHGSYLIHVGGDQPGIRSSMEGPIEFEVPTTATATDETLRVSVPLRRGLHRLQLRHPDRLRRVSVRGGSGAVRPLRLRQPDSLLWLPEGDYEFLDGDAGPSLGTVSIGREGAEPSELRLDPR